MRPASMPGLLAITFTATVAAAQAPPPAPATILAYAIAGTTPAGVTQLAPGSNYNAKGSNKVKRTDKGRYEVSFGGFAIESMKFGLVMASHVGAENFTCKVTSFTPDKAGVSAKVSCFNDKGEPVDTSFAIICFR